MKALLNSTVMRRYTFLVLFAALLGTNFLSINIGAKLSAYRLLLLLSPLLFFKLWQDKKTLNGTLYKHYAVFLTFWCLYSLLLIFFIKDFSGYVRNFFFLICAWISACFIGVYIRKISDVINAFKIVEVLAIFTSLIGVYEIITGNYSFVSSEKQVYYTTRSALDSIIGVRVPISIFGNPNDYSLFLIFSIFITYSLSLVKTTLRGKVFSVAVFIFLVFMLIATQSRASFLGFLTGWIFLTIVSFKQSDKLRRGFMIIIALLCIGYGILPWIVSSSDNGTTANTYITTSSDNIRINLIKNGFVFLLKTYGLGVGIGNIEHYMSHNAVFPIRGIFNIHNWWMEILVSSGFLVFCFYLYIYMYNFISSIKSVRYLKNSVQEKAIAASMSGILVAFVLGSMGSSSLFTDEWCWVSFSLVLASISVMQKSRTDLQNIGDGVFDRTLSSEETTKILFVSRGYPSDKDPLAGIFEFDQAKAVSKLGYDVIFLSLDLRSIRRWRKWGVSSLFKDRIRIYNISFPVGAVPAKLFYKIGTIIIRYAYKLIQKKEGKVNLVHAHFSEIAAIASVLKNKYHIPLIVTEHSSAVHESKLDAGTEFMAQKAYMEADALIAVSQSLSKSIRQHFGIDSYVIPNMVDVDNVSFSPHRHDAFVFTSIGTLVERKGFDLLIRAFAIFKGQNVKLQIIGDGPLKSKLHKKITDLGLDNQVWLVGYKPRAEISQILNASDAFVLVSRWEPFGVAYIEALLAGLPVIGTRCGGPEDFINDKNGMLVPVDDCDQLCKAMMRMKENIDKYDKSEIHENCLKKFSPETIAAQLSDIYKQTLLTNQCLPNE